MIPPVDGSRVSDAVQQIQIATVIFRDGERSARQNIPDKPENLIDLDVFWSIGEFEEALHPQ